MKLHGFTAVASSLASAKPAEAVSAYAKELSSLASADYPLRIHPRLYRRGFLRRRVNIYQKARFASTQAVNKIVFRTRWETVRHIVEVEQKHNLRASHGEHLLERFSPTLTAEIGKGFSVPNLQYMRRLHICYQIRQAPDELSWTHLQALLLIKNDEKRRFFEEQAIKQKWSSRDLLKQIRRDKIELVRIGF